MISFKATDIKLMSVALNEIIVKQGKSVNAVHPYTSLKNIKLSTRPMCLVQCYVID